MPNSSAKSLMSSAKGPVYFCQGRNRSTKSSTAPMSITCMPRPIALNRSMRQIPRSVVASSCGYKNRPASALQASGAWHSIRSRKKRGAPGARGHMRDAALRELRLPARVVPCVLAATFGPFPPRTTGHRGGRSVLAMQLAARGTERDASCVTSLSPGLTSTVGSQRIRAATGLRASAQVDTSCRAADTNPVGMWGESAMRTRWWGKGTWAVAACHDDAPRERGRASVLLYQISVRRNESGRVRYRIPRHRAIPVRRSPRRLLLGAEER